MYTIPLTAAQTDTSDATAYTGLIFPSGNFTVEAYQNSDGNLVSPVEYTIASPVAVPEPASLSLLALGAIPMLRRRSKSV